MSIRDEATSQLRRMVRAFYPAPASERAEKIFSAATRSWGAAQPDGTPPWSAIGRDCSPYEFSVAFLPHRADLRVVVEAQGAPATPASYWRAAAALNAEFERDHAISLAHWQTVADLFHPESPTFCSLWHGLRFRPDGSLELRLYANPGANRRRDAFATVSEALRRLGLARAIDPLAGMLQGSTRVGLFAVDLGVVPRVKVYLAHQGATVQSLAALVGRADAAAGPDVLAFTEAILADSGPFDGEPIRICVTVDAEDPERLSRWTLDVPLVGYVDNDAVAQARILDVFSRFRLAPDAYRRSLLAFDPHMTTDRLHLRDGMHSVVSFQRDNRSPRVTVYFSPQTYRHSWRSEDAHEDLFRHWNRDLLQEAARA